MKDKILLLLLTGLFCIFIQPSIVEAASLDVNGTILQDSTKEDFLIDQNRIFISENLLKKTFFLSLHQEENRYELANENRNIIITGQLNDAHYRLNNTQQTLTSPVRSYKKQLYFPLRSLMDQFGTVEWDAPKAQARVRFDYYQFEQVKPFKYVDTPLMVEETLLENIPATCTPATVLENGQTVFEERLEKGWIVSVKTSEDTLLRPQHKGYIISTYNIGKEDLSWIEIPETLSEAPQNWYLYTKKRHKNSPAICVEEASFNHLKNMSYGEYILRNICFTENNIFYLYFNDATNSLKVRLYDHKTQEKTVLDSLSLTAHPNGTMALALNNDMAVWTKTLLLERMREYGALYTYDLKAGTTKRLFKGSNFLTPHLNGDYLILRHKPQGENFLIDEASGKLISGEIWVYDLAHKKWVGKIDRSLPMCEDSTIISFPVLLGKDRMTVDLEAIGEPYDMPIVSLSEGVIYRAKNARGEILQYEPYGINNGVPRHISPTRLENTYLVQYRQDNRPYFMLHTLTK